MPERGGVCTPIERSATPRPVCEVDGVTADLLVVDALARLQLAAQRRGCRVRLSGASDELRQLLSFMGLEDVLPA
jgi:ABC-type transporter Mla MlaB component